MFLYVPTVYGENVQYFHMFPTKSPHDFPPENSDATGCWWSSPETHRISILCIKYVLCICSMVYSVWRYIYILLLLLIIIIMIIYYDYYYYYIYIYILLFIYIYLFYYIYMYHYYYIYYYIYIIIHHISLYLYIWHTRELISGILQA